ncbi:MAG TPA: ribosome biogenesis GTPase YqeH [Mollicutes bacterium]|nr:ribosome biogenesis GTPase YqeH [Mollicutes bacterium]
MNKKCSGCGVVLQIDKPEAIGYVEPNMYEKSRVCRRCFRLKFYGDYIFVDKSNGEYEEVLKEINNTGDLVIYMVDLFNISEELIYVDKLLNNQIILVLTKRDIIPKSVKDKKIIKKLEEYNLDVIDIISISSEKNYNLDKLYKLILKHKKSNNVYVVGNTNAGKSSFINKMMVNYSSNKSYITTSMLPSTTLDIMEIKLNDKLTLVDTPGLVEEGNVVDCYDYMTLKRIVPKKEIKPRTYQLDPKRCLLVENFAQIEYVEGGRNSFTLYLSNELNVKNEAIGLVLNVPKAKKETFIVEPGEDIVISGLGWIKIVDKAIVDIYVNEKIKVFKRKSII